METTSGSLGKHREKILIITYYWPPSGGPGVLRWLNYCNELIKDFDIFILTTQNGDYPVIDRSLEKKINPRIKVFRTKSPSLQSIAKKFIKKDEKIPYGSLETSKKDSLAKKMMMWTRINLVIPDARVVWNPFAIKKANEIILENSISKVITTGPPNSTHLIGLYLKRKINKIKWIADFRDPWTDAFWISNVKRAKASKSIDNFLEKSVLNEADKIFTVSPSILELFKNKGINLSNRGHIFLNGLEKLSLPKNNSNKIVFFGNLTEFQNPESLFKATKNINNLEILFIGKQFEGFEILKKKYAQVKTKPYLPYPELMEFTKDALAFFLPYVVTGSYTDGIIGTKFFDYIQQQKPIIALGKKNSYAHKMIKDHNLGFFHDYNEIEKITQSIQQIINNKDNFWRYNNSINNFLIPNITAQISKIIKEL